jgi:pilus assembly protein CpaE
MTAPASLAECRDVAESAFDRLLDIAQSSAPILIVDVPHLWNSWTKRILLTCDEVVIAAQPVLASLRNTKSLLDVLTEARPNDTPPKVVLNQVGMPKRKEIKPSEFGAALHCEPVVWIPFDADTVSTAANSGQMLADVSATAPVCRSLIKLATLVSGRSSQNDKRAFTLAHIWNACQNLLPRNAAQTFAKHGFAK